MKLKRDYIYIAIILVALVFYYIEHQTNKDSLNAARKELLFQKEDRQKEFKKFEGIIKLKDDSLRVAKDSIKLINQEKKSVEILLARKNKSHEKIIFVPLTDSTRSSELSKLYPSYVRP